MKELTYKVKVDSVMLLVGWSTGEGMGGWVRVDGWREKVLD